MYVCSRKTLAKSLVSFDIRVKKSTFYAEILTHFDRITYFFTRFSPEMRPPK